MVTLKNFIKNFVEKGNFKIYESKLNDYFWIKFNENIIIDDEPVNVIVISNVLKNKYDLLFSYNENLEENIKYIYKNVELANAKNIFKTALENKEFC